MRGIDDARGVSVRMTHIAKAELTYLIAFCHETVIIGYCFLQRESPDLLRQPQERPENLYSTHSM